jgi:hypothetical protein
MRQKRLSIRAGVRVTSKWSALEPLTSPPHDPSFDTTLIVYMMMPPSSYHTSNTKLVLEQYALPPFQNKGLGYVVENPWV